MHSCSLTLTLTLMTSYGDIL